jgi:hypothetical protein
MQRQILLLAGLCLALSGLAQTDTSGVIPYAPSTPSSPQASSASTSPKTDTVRIGNLIIIKEGDAHADESETIRIRRRREDRDNYKSEYKPANVSTNWFIFDLGFSNYTDKTDYTSAAAQQFAPGATADWFHLRTGKSINVNIWLFMQRLNLIKHVVNLKYGLGIELNNYRYTDNIKYLKDPTRVIMDSISYNKNKLAADYYTIPFMLNFNFTPGRKDGFGLSLGASAGYKYSSRQKLRSAQTGKYKIHDDFDMEPWKISWIGELQLGFVRLYGSLATKSMFQKGLDQTPYTVGIRFSNW